MQADGRPVLVVASSREDRRVLFDALDGMGFGEILSAPNAAQARALIERSTRPVLAILDFEHMSNAARILCSELADMPVLGLFGTRFLARQTRDRLAEHVNIKAWLRVPVTAGDVTVRVREALHATVAAAAPAQDAGQRATVATLLSMDIGATLQALAEVLQPGRDAAGLPGLVARAMRVLDMDVMVVAGRTPGGALESLAGAGNLSGSGQPDLFAQAFVQRALRGETMLNAGGRMPAAMAAYARATGCVRCAAVPLFDAQRAVLGVLVCASQRTDGLDASWLQPLLDIVSTRFAGLLELRALRGRDRAQALLDGLTGLPNRILFHDRLESALHDARRTGELLAVLFIDLDRFKGINDSLGHAVGDQVLVAVAERLLGSVRASDTVARYAGDEFTVILRHVNGRADVSRVATKLLAGMQAPLTLENGAELHVTCSVGVSLYPDDATDADGLLKQADMAMYSAKGEGRNNVKAFGNVPEETHRQHLEMAARLRDAEANGELSVHYQPQVDLASGDTVAVEALVRWQHPVLGMLSPGFFVPLAEETGLIIPLGEWVLRQACSDVAGWRRRTGRPLRLAVNLSALQWMQPNLAAMVQAACRDAGLGPQDIDLETPEGVLVNPPAELVASVHALRSIGCRVVVDDAGVAQGAPGHAPRLPVDALKIDQGFIHNIGSDPDDEAVVLAILAGARQRHLRTVAEGVETDRQLDFLRGHGCDAAQGYLFCRPLPAAALAGRLLKPGA